MAKNNITQYDATAANNTDIDSINIAEGMAASDVNNAIRSLMSHLKNMDTGSQALTSPSFTAMSTDTINEKTSTNGVAIDSVTLKDGELGTTASPVPINSSSLNGGQFGGRRNLIINGAMQVSQRGTSFTSQTADHYFVDRFKLGATSLGTWTTSQSTDSPDGFAYSAKIECTTADASPASTDLLYFYSRFEGQNLQQLKFGTSDAESVTISFYVKCSKTGVFTVNWRNQDAGRSIGSDVTISSADTWEFKTITFSGDTSGSFNNDNGWSANLEFMLNAGTNYTSGNTLTSYASHSNTNGTRAGGTTLALGANIGETIQFTGIQVEVGSVATPFEHRSFGEELGLCQRYFNIFGTDTSNAFENFGIAVAFGSGAGNIRMPMNMPVTMRAIPSVAHSGAFACIGQLNIGTLSSIGLADGGSPTNIMLNITGSNSVSSGDVSPFRSNNDVDAFISFDSEL